MNDIADLSPATVRHALPFLVAGQVQKEFFVNEALARIDLLLHSSIDGQHSSPPATPAVGAVYLVTAPAVGDFAERDSCLAGWDGDQWTFVSPLPGMRILDRTSGTYLRFTSAWQASPAPVPAQGGATIDSEARAAIESILAILRFAGLAGT